jgi:putative holliday junction resolvase
MPSAGLPPLRPSDAARVITTAPSEFRATLAESGRLIGLDVGTKTIGTALCDAGWNFASPADLIKRTKFTADLAALRSQIAAQSVVGIVIGLPLNLDGSDSPRTQSVRAFARNVAVLELPILLWDERWSTQAVERAMIAADVSRGKRAARIDNAAAAFILQGAIDALMMA